LFVDFDGVLCRNKYWLSLPPLLQEIIQELLFRNDIEMTENWMRGKHTSEEINDFLAPRLGMDPAELWKIFVRDCENLFVDTETLERLRSLRARYYVALVTGNMDSFSRFTVPSMDLSKYFDKISNSFYEGMLKTDNGGEIFLRLCSEIGTGVERALLIDDSERVCEVFGKLGGHPLRVIGEKDINYHLDRIERS